MTGMLAFLLHPMTLGKTQEMLLLLPLCLAISVVYKTTKCSTLSEVPVAALVSWVTIVIGMYAVGAALLILYHWLA